MHTRFVAFLCLVIALGPGCPAGAEKNKRLAPIADGDAKSTHGPYGAGACESCHERHDPDDPGRVAKVTNEICLGCHEEFAAGTPVRLDRSIHPVNDAPCLGCHNPHNARKPKLQM